MHRPAELARTVSVPELSVVMAAHADDVREALAAIVASCAGLDAEVIVVHNADVAPMIPPARAAREQPDRNVFVCEVTSPPSSLVPVQWGEGARVARGRVVAFTTSHMRVSATWARALLAALPVASMQSVSASVSAWGVGGTIALDARRSTAVDTAYFLRFSAFMPTLREGARPVRNIAGDNAAYRREAITRYPELLADGFWEVEFHQSFERDGGRLFVVPGAEATLASSERYSTLMRQRWAHARTFGAWRVARHGVSLLRVALAAPLVPFVLLWRIEQRVLESRRNWDRFARVWPRLLPLTFAWAAGEMMGALVGAKTTTSATSSAHTDA